MVRTARVHRHQNVSKTVADFKRFQNYHNYYRKLKIFQNRVPYEMMIEWYEKKMDLFLCHSADMTNFWKERGEA